MWGEYECCSENIGMHMLCHAQRSVTVLEQISEMPDFYRKLHLALSYHPCCVGYGIVFVINNTN